MPRPVSPEVTRRAATRPGGRAVTRRTYLYGCVVIPTKARLRSRSNGLARPVLQKAVDGLWSDAELFGDPGLPSPQLYEPLSRDPPALAGLCQILAEPLHVGMGREQLVDRLLLVHAGALFQISDSLENLPDRRRIMQLAGRGGRLMRSRPLPARCR